MLESVLLPCSSYVGWRALSDLWSACLQLFLPFRTGRLMVLCPSSLPSHVAGTQGRRDRTKA